MTKQELNSKLFGEVKNAEVAVKALEIIREVLSQWGKTMTAKTPEAEIDFEQMKPLFTFLKKECKISNSNEMKEALVNIIAGQTNYEHVSVMRVTNAETYFMLEQK